MARPKSKSKFIRERRQENGLTQQELADKLQVTQPTIAYWESGKGDPDAKTFKKIEKILGPLYTSSSSLSPVIEQSLFSSWLRTERTKSGLSIQELADRAKLPYATIWQIENDKISSPRQTTIKKIEKALHRDFTNNYDSDDSIEYKGLVQFQEFNPYDTSERPNEPGVYVFYDISERPIYVGQGQKISQRIKEHEDKFWFKNPIVETAAYIKVSDKKLRESVETVLIKFLKSNAVINKQKVDR
jgi:transcriptional regulator with XRE-family HTH domain